MTSSVHKVELGKGQISCTKLPFIKGKYKRTGCSSSKNKPKQMYDRNTMATTSTERSYAMRQVMAADTQSP